MLVCRCPSTRLSPRNSLREAIGKLNQAVSFHFDVESETRKIAAERIANERNQQEEIAKAIEARVYESLNGVSRADAKHLRLVMPDEKVTPVVNASINNTIAKVNSGPLVGYLLLTETEAQKFSDGQGGYRQDNDWKSNRNGGGRFRGIQQAYWSHGFQQTQTISHSSHLCVTRL